jgi:hypothetical protein
MNFGAPSFVGLGPPAFAGPSTSAVAGLSTSTSPWAIDSGGGEASSTPRLSPPPLRMIFSGHGMPEPAPQFKKMGRGRADRVLSNTGGPGTAGGQYNCRLKTVEDDYTVLSAHLRLYL